MPCFCSLLSGVPALYRLLQGEVGHRCFISFNLWKWYHMCVSFFWLVIQMFNLNMSHLIFLLLSSLPSTCAHTAWTDCPLGSYVGIDQVGQPCHWGVSKCACAWVLGPTQLIYICLPVIVASCSGWHCLDRQWCCRSPDKHWLLHRWWSR